VDPSPVFLIGFMATGKSTVGRLVADRLGRRFVDLDAEIERQAGMTIADIFREEGEAHFRRLEADSLARVANDPHTVIACGGGAPCFGDNLTRMRGAGVVVSLTVPFDEVLARTAGDSSRPLLRQGREAAERLYAARERVYRGADVVIDAARKSPETIADEITARLSRRLGDVAVRLGDRSYPIHVGPLARAAELAAELIPGATAFAVISDENVARAGHARAVASSLEAAGARVVSVTIPSGEAHKRLATVERVAGACARGGLDRRSAILAVGGGVVGDLAGFVAAILFRGVRCAQLPTTLLAMIDSSIGGKTGVDLDEGKNLAGAFWQPRFVLADPATLATLPERERRAALGEALKYGLLGDAALWDALASRGEAAAADLVLRCARMKADLVSRDEREETGERALLNLGHTVGHAIESASGYRRLHGECVALGLVAAARVSAALSLCDPALPVRVQDAVRACGLDADLEPWLRDDVLAYVGVDKKRAGPTLRFVAIEAVGRPKLVEISPGELSAILRPPSRG
jgi:shikimate kinase/3-dehydroquinate synthase